MGSSAQIHAGTLTVNDLRVPVANILSAHDDDLSWAVIDLCLFWIAGAPTQS